MSLRGSCRCSNLQVVWHTVDYSIVPRACCCAFCQLHGAAWVSKAGTRFELHVQRQNQHITATQGSNTARFHLCGQCDQLVCVTANIEGEVYGALNASCLTNPLGFAPAALVDVSELAPAEKLARWRANWCVPVSVPVVVR